MQETFELTVDWRGFELHPETPLGGMPLDALIPADQAAMLTAQVQRLADQQGAGAMRFSDRVPNTRAALAVAEFARDQGALWPYEEAAMQACWRDGLNLEDPEHLATILERAGLDPEAGLRASADPTYLQRVDALRAEARRAGVTGIPTFFFGDGPPVVGARPFADLAKAAQAAGAQAR